MFRCFFLVVVDVAIACYISYAIYSCNIVVDRKRRGKKRRRRGRKREEEKRRRRRNTNEEDDLKLLN